MGEKMAKAKTYRVTIPEDKAGERLDRVLAAILAEAAAAGSMADGSALSRTRLQALIADGCVTSADGTPVRATMKVRAGDVFGVSVPAPRSAKPKPQAMKLHILHEDDDLIVLEKPAGLVVHPAPGNPDRTLVNALLAHCRGKLSGIGGVARPGIVHRLDKDTSGLMVVAKTDRAHQGLSRQLADRTMTRVYRALVWGVPARREGTIEGAIGRHPRNRKKMAVLKRGGKVARTHYKVIRVLDGALSVVECRLATGRTHQIRVHMAHVGHPLVGDGLYGGAVTAARLKGVPAAIAGQIRGVNTQVLHAFYIALEHPSDRKKLSFKSYKLCNFNKLLS
ncbi:MAG: RluA family pseudouridine synthase [Alphaproteobacteria bacterium]|nr:RluA family pseudouridine synthase [Alphaproteobacteria bacterium]